MEKTKANRSMNTAHNRESSIRERCTETAATEEDEKNVIAMYKHRMPLSCTHCLFPEFSRLGLGFIDY